jgi:tetratricopeptide (TPR) repeat protein
MERWRGPDHVETAALLSELGDLYRYLAQHEQAQKCLRRALDIHERECGLWSTEAAHDLNLLAGSFEACGNLKGAAAEHERILGLKQRGVGANMEQLGESQFALAQLYVRWGNLTRARELLMEVIGTFRRQRTIQLAMAYEALANIEEQQGHLRGALDELLHASHVWEQLPVEHTRDLCRNLLYQAQIFDALHQREDAAYVRQRLAALDRATGWAAAS